MTTPQQNIQGFTLIELIMVMVLVGILAVAVIPRFADRKTFDARGFYEQSIEMLRYAQKTAIAQRREVFVNITASTICLTYAADAACSGGNNVLNPADQQSFVKTAPAGVSFSAALSFSFTALGRPTPNNAYLVNISGDGVTRSITVERETGYVH
ncbi:MAG: prepilin-type N-terminal cleavage/methylation domain-containing protein [Burkholderiales bacterium]|nr:prepilin-type N-terminal cleavage/methylation domain-containing protein [Burkholderiales bacterium]